MEKFSFAFLKNRKNLQKLILQQTVENKKMIIFQLHKFYDEKKIDEKLKKKSMEKLIVKNGIPQNRYNITLMIQTTRKLEKNSTTNLHQFTTHQYSYRPLQTRKISITLFIQNRKLKTYIFLKLRSRSR